MKSGFIMNVVASIIASLIVGIAVYLYDKQIISKFYILIIIILLVAIIISLVVLLIRTINKQNQPLACVNFHSILSTDQVKNIIENASDEIWAFQVSGGHHTRSLTEDYKKWLAGNRNRQLKIMFLNSENHDLVISVGVLLGRIPSEVINRSPTDLQHFLDEIERTITEYSNLKKLFPSQVQMRLYNCSPPCSILGCDLNSSNKERQVITVENYIYGLLWSQRPCFTLRYDTEKLFETYKRSLKQFFDDSQEFIIT